MVMKMPTEGFKVILLSKNRKLKKEKDISLFPAPSFWCPLINFLNPHWVTGFYWSLFPAVIGQTNKHSHSHSHLRTILSLKFTSHACFSWMSVGGSLFKLFQSQTGQFLLPACYIFTTYDFLKSAPFSLKFICKYKV